jgi:flagellum-specific ATP synthase
MIDVTSNRHQNAAQGLRRALATHRDAQDLINIGAYVKGSNPEIDEAIRIVPRINKFLQQGLQEPSDFGALEAKMEEILK